ncbi:MAG TPA: YqaJ viral recombinase family protein, partial [Pseudomonadales bacterium]|nr:YqaJ viral recombinase family protein [Pseudomonadales bacterium]
AKTKSGWGSSRANLRAKLVVERLTGQQEEGFIRSAAMQWGVDKEDEARIAYSFVTGNDVTEVGLYKHPTIIGSHASPDGLVGDDGCLEIKCPNSSTHIEVLKTKQIAHKYILQMQWQMACTDRQWCDFVSYDPRMPDHLMLYIQRVQRDNDMLAILESEVAAFLVEVDEDVKALSKLGDQS